MRTAFPMQVRWGEYFARFGFRAPPSVCGSLNSRAPSWLLSDGVDLNRGIQEGASLGVVRVAALTFGQ